MCVLISWAAIHLRAVKPTSRKIIGLCCLRVSVHIPCKILPVTWITTSQKVWESDLSLLHAKREISHFRLFRKRITTTCAENRAILSLVSLVGCTAAGTITQQLFIYVRKIYVSSVYYHQITSQVSSNYHPSISSKHAQDHKDSPKYELWPLSIDLLGLATPERKEWSPLHVEPGILEEQKDIPSTNMVLVFQNDGLQKIYWLLAEISN